MTNTVIIIPVNQDTRPTEFYSAFETEDGVRVTMTIDTREQAVADAITEKVTSLGWTRAPVPSDTPLWQIFFMVPFGLLIIWVMWALGAWLFSIAEWAPTLVINGEALSGFDLFEYLTKIYIRLSLVLWLPLFAVFSYFELENRKEVAKAIVE